MVIGKLRQIEKSQYAKEEDLYAIELTINNIKFTYIPLIWATHKDRILPVFPKAVKFDKQDYDNIVDYVNNWVKFKG